MQNMNGTENIFNLVENGTILIFYNFIFLLVLIIWTLGLSDFGGWSIRRVKSGADINILRNFNDVMFPRMDIPNWLIYETFKEGQLFQNDIDGAPFFKTCDHDWIGS